MVYMEKHHLFSSNFATPRGDIYQCLGTLLIVTTKGKVTTDNQLVEARDIAKHPMVHRIVPTTKDDPTQNVSSAKVGNLGVADVVDGSLISLWHYILHAQGCLL